MAQIIILTNLKLCSVVSLKIISNQVKHGSLNLKMKFVCAQCWRNGQVSEPDKNRKYCSAKARHP